MAEKKKPDQSKDDGETTEHVEGLDPGVVGIRRVVTVPMSRVEAARRAGKDTPQDEVYANAPKPVKNNEYRPKLVQIRRKHKRPGSKDKPNYMSDIKI